MDVDEDGGFMVLGIKEESVEMVVVQFIVMVELRGFCFERCWIRWSILLKRSNLVEGVSIAGFSSFR